MAVDIYALAELDQLKQHLKITTTGDDDILERTLTAARQRIETYCKRSFFTRSYTDELYDGTGDDFLLLDNYPVTEVDRVAEGRLQVISITNTISDATRATIAVGALGMSLTITGGTSAGTDPLTWVVSATFTAVVAAINALGKGCAAAVSSSAYGTYVSTELIECPGRECLNGTIYLDMAEVPGVSDYICHWSEGILERTAGRWARGSRNITVDYTAGFTTIPDDIEAACIEIATLLYSSGERDPAMKSEKLGDYAYTMADLTEQLSMTSRSTLEAYRDRRV